MITKKREMAGWIFDFFRSAKADINGVVMMRTIQKKLIELNPKERDLFIPVANELIENGYLTYEEGPLQYLRLTQKGRDYIYNPSAELDCCYEEKYSPAQAQYIDNWHKSFVAYVNQLRGLVSILMTSPEASEDDKRGLEKCQLILNGKDVQWIEGNLSNGVVNRELLEKIEKLNRDLVDEAVGHLKTDFLAKEFLRQLTYLKIAQDKKAEEMRLGLLKIKI